MRSLSAENTEAAEFELWEEMRKYDSPRLHMELHSQDELRRFAAAKALHIKGKQDTFAYVLPLCDASNASLRAVAACVLGQLGTPERPFLERSLPILSRLLCLDPEASVRAEAAAALGHLASPDALDDLTTASKDMDADVRANAAFAFGKINNRKSIQELLRLTYDPDADVRMWAVIGLKCLSKESPVTRTRLAELLNDPSEGVREELKNE